MHQIKSLYLEFSRDRDQYFLDIGKHQNYIHCASLISTMEDLDNLSIRAKWKQYRASAYNRRITSHFHTSITWKEREKVEEERTCSWMFLLSLPLLTASGVVRIRRLNMPLDF